MSELSNLANAGLAGVAIVAIIGLVYVVRTNAKCAKAQEKEFMNFIANHIETHTKANQRLADMIEQLLRWLEKNNR